jgi:hypothetical protein
MPKDVARFPISAATAITDRATAAKRVETGQATASSAATSETVRVSSPVTPPIFWGVTIRDSEALVIALGICKLAKSQRKARKGRNPQTGAAIKIPAKTVVKFRLAKSCNDVVAQKK